MSRVSIDHRGEAVRVCHRAGADLQVAERGTAIRCHTIARHEQPPLVALRLRQTLLEGSPAVATLTAQGRSSLTLLTAPSPAATM